MQFFGDQIVHMFRMSCFAVWVYLFSVKVNTLTFLKLFLKISLCVNKEA